MLSNTLAGVLWRSTRWSYTAASAGQRRTVREGDRDPRTIRSHGEGYTGHARDSIPCYCWSKTDAQVGRSTAAMVIREACPACGAKRDKNHGHTRHGKQHHQCHLTGYEFSAAQELLVLAKVEGNSSIREWCSQKNAEDSGAQPDTKHR